MRALAFALATAAVLGVAVPARAQGVYVRVGDGGVGIAVGPGYYGSRLNGPYRYHHGTWQGLGWAYSGSPHYGYSATTTGAVGTN
jgi:hypothetical protein